MGVNDGPGPPSGGGGTGWSRRGLGEATYNGAGLQSWESGLSATQSIRSDPLKTAKDLFFDLCEPGHGRIQRWQLKACAVEPDAVDFPFARSVVIVRSERTVKKTAVSSFETRAYICSDLSDQRTPYHWLELIRGHWAGVEIRNHWKRDALMGEDRSRTRNPNALANLAALRSVCLHLIANSHPDLPWPVVRERLSAKPAACLSLLTS